MNDRSALDERAGREGWIGWVAQDQAAFNRGAFGRIFGGSGGSSGGGVEVFLLFAFAPLMVMVGPFLVVPLYPVRGGIACVFGLLGYFLTPGGDNNVHLVTLLPAFLGLAAFLGTGKYEERAEENPKYLLFRAYTRVLFVPIVIDTLLIPLLLYFLVDFRTAWDWSLASGIDVVKLLRIVALTVGFYFLLRWRGRSVSSPATP